MTNLPTNAIVWTEIPVRNLEKAVAFYSKLLGNEMSIVTDMGPQPIAMFPVQDHVTGVAGHLYEGPTVEGGPTVHFAVEGTVEDAQARARAAGGKTLDHIVTIPAGRFGYAIDPDGNSLGLFEGN